jgi:hypothetical protein
LQVPDGPQITNGGENVDAVWQKVANILVAVTEKQLSKVLHVYPDSGFTKHLTEVTPTFTVPAATGLFSYGILLLVDRTGHLIWRD